MIPQADPRAQYLQHKQEIDAAIQRTLDAGQYILGSECAAFEKEFAAYIGTDYGIGVGSGTDALVLALRALGVGETDEVITVSHTAVVTVAAIELAGATPVLVDVEPRLFTMDPNSFRKSLTGKTKAVVAVSLYGQAVSSEIVDIARNSGLALIEDCAQAHGATQNGKKLGSLGDVSCFSFYPTKNLGALGDGGMVLTNRPEVADSVRLLRQYGWRERYVSEIPGVNSRLDELQAAILRVKLRHLDDDNQRRAAIAARYDAGLADLPLLLPERRQDSGHVFHLYVVRSDRRQDLQEFLRRNGVGTAIHYAIPVHGQPAYRRLQRYALRVTDQIADEVLSLPMFPGLSEEAVSHVIATVRQFFAQVGG